MEATVAALHMVAAPSAMRGRELRRVFCSPMSRARTARACSVEACSRGSGSYFCWGGSSS